MPDDTTRAAARLGTLGARIRGAVRGTDAPAKPAQPTRDPATPIITYRKGATDTLLPPRSTARPLRRRR